MSKYSRTAHIESIGIARCNQTSLFRPLNQDAPRGAHR
jgi:hypothetical protein